MKRHKNSPRMERHSRRVTGTYGIGAVELRGARSERFSDLYYFLLSTSWPRFLLLATATFIAANALFALGYYLIGGIENVDPHSYADAFFFSVQTMATVGYGRMAPRGFGAEMLVTVQAFVALLGLALMTGLSFGKFSRPTARIRFSRVAVVSNHNGRPCLMFRMSNLRLNHIVEARANVVMVRSTVTAEGTQFRTLVDLELERHLSPLFSLTWTAIHPITPKSPLHGLTEQSLLEQNVGIVVSLTGTDGTLFQTVHARHDYEAHDIRWNARFVDILHENRDGSATIDLTRFDEVEELAPRTGAKT